MSSLREEKEFQELQSARAQAAAWALGVAGAELRLRKLRDQHLECLEDIDELRQRIETVARGATPQQQQCAQQLDNAVANLASALRRSDNCYSLAHHQVGRVGETVQEFGAAVDRQVARMQRAARPRAAQQRGEFAVGSRTRRS